MQEVFHVNPDNIDIIEPEKRSRPIKTHFKDITKTPNSINPKINTTKYESYKHDISADRKSVV